MFDVVIIVIITRRAINDVFALQLNSLQGMANWCVKKSRTLNQVQLTYTVFTLN